MHVLCDDFGWSWCSRSRGRGRSIGTHRRAPYISSAEKRSGFCAE